jgi:hypothetical protein
MTTTSEVGHNAGQRTSRPATRIAVFLLPCESINRLVLLSKLARVIARLDHVPSVVVNANHSIMMRAASQHRVTNRAVDCCTRTYFVSALFT